MFGQQLTMKLKADALRDLIRISDSEVISILRRHKGFRDQTTLIASERAEVVTNSFWTSREDAEAFTQTGYPEVLIALAPVIEGIPTVKTFDVASPTCHSSVVGKLQ